MAFSIDNYTGVALANPLELNDQGGFNLSKGSKTINESLDTILNTPKGSVFMRPEYGSNLHKYIFEQNDNILTALLENEIQDALTLWEPRINIISINCVTDPKIVNLINCFIRYNLVNLNEANTFIYPFYKDIPA